MSSCSRACTKIQSYLAEACGGPKHKKPHYYPQRVNLAGRMLDAIRDSMYHRNVIDDGLGLDTMPRRDIPTRKLFHGICYLQEEYYPLSGKVLPPKVWGTNSLQDSKFFSPDETHTGAHRRNFHSSMLGQLPSAEESVANTVEYVLGLQSLPEICGAGPGAITDTKVPEGVMDSAVYTAKAHILDSSLPVPLRLEAMV